MARSWTLAGRCLVFGSLAVLLLVCVAPASALPSSLSTLFGPRRVLAEVTSSDSPVPAPAPAPEEEEEGEPAPVTYYQVHGWLMWLGFGVLMPIGIIVSRHLQTVTPFWFHAHWVSQVLAVLCVTPAFAIAVNSFDALDSVHAQMGIAIFIMMALQPVLAIVRPHKGTALRAVWYVTHWMLGMAAVALGWWNCFTGLQLYTEAWTTDTTTLQNLFIASIAVLSFIYLILGRWDYIVSQTDSKPQVDGLKRFPSVAHLSSLLKGHATASSGGKTVEGEGGEGEALAN